jgi:hypothetical protein
MKQSQMPGQRLVAVFLLGGLLLNYPILFLFDRHDEVFGIPLLYFYIFCVWTALIVLMGCIAERAGD